MFTPEAGLVEGTQAVRVRATLASDPKVWSEATVTVLSPAVSHLVPGP